MLMQAALDAIAHQGHTWPNPCVGCALADAAGNLLAAACSATPDGRPHAETVALRHAPNPYAAYVTLEPCNNASTNKPTSCTDALLAAGIRELHVGVADPDPRMMGKSLAKFRAAGVKVFVGEQRHACYHQHRGHITRAQLQRPYVTLKMAHSRDGFIARTGERTPISSEASWQHTYAIRGKMDAVMIGASTALTDDPQLTARGLGPNPVRIVVDTNARLPASSTLARTAHETPVWLLAAKPAPHLEQLGVRVIQCPLHDDKIDLRAALRQLAKEGLTHILVEGGNQLAQSLLAYAVVDEIIFIEGAMTLGQGVPLPTPRGMLQRDEQTIGPDTWRTYDSIASLHARDDLFDLMETL